MISVNDELTKALSGVETQSLNGVVSIAELLNRKKIIFSIPSYQRGYRWRKENVSALLQDILEYADSERNVYCLQPLVLCPQWVYVNSQASQIFQIVDGQQRLTTLTIILNELKKKMPSIPTVPWDLYYEEAEGDAGVRFLSALLKNPDSDTSINGFFRQKASCAVEKWLSERSDEQLHQIASVLAEDGGKHVVFVSYELRQNQNPVDCVRNVLGNEDEHDAFMRLNDGKVDLTSAELVKAMYLVDPNGLSEDKKIEIVKEWEIIEATLRREEFWRVFNRDDDGPYTRIEYLLACVVGVDEDSLKRRSQSLTVFHKIEDIVNKSAIDDERRYRPELREKGLLKIWQSVLQLYMWMQSCIADLETANFLGWIKTFTDNQIKTIYDIYRNGRLIADGKFQEIELGKITDLTRTIEENELGTFGCFKKNLMSFIAWRICELFPGGLKNAYYEDGDFKNAEKFRKLLVLLNILVCNHNRERFRFDRYHAEESAFTSSGERKKTEKGRNILGWQIEHVHSRASGDGVWDRSVRDINRIWNLTLLDGSTNQRYQDSDFLIKREYLQRNMDDPDFYVVPLTQRVFMKFYSQIEPDNDWEGWKRWKDWTYEIDGLPYMRQMQKLYGEFVRVADPDLYRANKLEEDQGKDK